MADAKEFFRENCRLFADPVSKPEQYNLYGGLLAMAKDIDDILNKINRIESDISYLKVK